MSVSLEMVDTQRVSLNNDKNCENTFQIDKEYQTSAFFDYNRVPQKHMEMKVDDSCEIPPDDPNSI